MRNKDDNRDNGIGAIFRGLDRFINIVADMMENNENEVDLKGVINDPEKSKKFMGKYGVNIKLSGENFGIDKLNTFNKSTSLNRSLPKVIEPMTDIFEEDDKVIIVMEIPLVEAEDISLDINDNILEINASTNENHYSKTIKLKFTPMSNSVEAKLNNSIYSIIINKDN